MSFLDDLREEMQSPTFPSGPSRGATNVGHETVNWIGAPRGSSERHPDTSILMRVHGAGRLGSRDSCYAEREMWTGSQAEQECGPRAKRTHADVVRADTLIFLLIHLSDWRPPVTVSRAAGGNIPSRTDVSVYWLLRLLPFQVSLLFAVCSDPELLRDPAVSLVHHLDEPDTPKETFPRSVGIISHVDLGKSL